MPELPRVDIAIIGAGMAGASLAAALQGQGLVIALLEARPVTLPELPRDCDVDSFDARVSALNLQSRALLERLGAWGEIAGYRQCAYRHMTVWDAEGTGCIDFDASEVERDCLGHIVENRAIIRGLLQGVLAAPDIRVMAPRRLGDIRLEPSGALLALDDGGVLEAGLVVAADGALSSVRQRLSFPTREWDYGHRALVTTVATEHPHRETARQRFLPTGPLAFLPLPGPEGANLCSIVWSLEEAAAGPVLELDDAAFREALGRASEWCLGEVLACSPRSAFPLRQRHAVDYVMPRVALVGDAAHTIHPLAGQGINLGFADVAVLAEEILAAHRRGADIGSLAVLRRYQRRRKGENLLMMGAMDAFKRLFEQDSLPLRWLRNAGMTGVDRSGPLKAGIMRRAMGLAP